MTEGERTLAVFIDFENLALGIKGKKDRRFEIQKVLGRLVEKGKIIVKKAYADWANYSEYKKPLHEAAIELIEIPKRSMTGKNSADIRLCVDSLDLCYSKEHIDTFVIVSGDSDFSPLVSKLKENGKHVIGLGMKDSSSSLLINNCDEFIYYEDLERPIGTPPKIEQEFPEQKKEAFQLLVDSVVALVRENKEILWSSMVKETMKRKKPSFNESYHGYRTFSDLLEDAEKRGILRLRTDARSGTYVVVGFGSAGMEKEKKEEKKEERKEERREERKEERKPDKPEELKESKPPKPHRRTRQRRPKPQTPVTEPAAPAPEPAGLPALTVATEAIPAEPKTPEPLSPAPELPAPHEQASDEALPPGPSSPPHSIYEELPLFDYAPAEPPKAPESASEPERTEVHLPEPERAAPEEPASASLKPEPAEPKPSGSPESDPPA
jgi:uncharacterized protein (TIGR00288 family)